MFGKFLDHRLRFMRPEKEWPSWSDPIAKFFEFRQRVLSENEEYTAILGRMTAAAGVTFATRIRGYGSLELDVAVGSVEKLARAFDDNFDAVRVFLDCFVPLAFADVFDVYVSGFSEQMKFDVKADTSLEREFSKARKRRAKVAAENATEAGDESTCTGSA